MHSHMDRKTFNTNYLKIWISPIRGRPFILPWQALTIPKIINTNATIETTELSNVPT